MPGHRPTFGANAMNKLIIKIHIAKSQLAMDDDTYRDVLENATGKRSSSDMNDAERERALAEFERLGWRPFRPKGAGHLYKRATSRKIIVLWKELHRANLVKSPKLQSMNAWLKANYGKSNPDWLDGDQASLAIEQLKKWLKRA